MHDFLYLSILGQKWSYNESTHSSSTLLDAVEYLNIIEDLGLNTWLGWLDAIPYLIIWYQCHVTIFMFAPWDKFCIQ